MKTIEWPPVLRGGKLSLISGADASRVLVAQTVGDLTQNPFNPPGLSLGDVTFRTSGVVRARVSAVLKRMNKLVTIQSITETDDQNGSKTISVEFTDRETNTKARVNADV